MITKILKNGIFISIGLGLLFPQGEKLGQIIPYLLTILLFFSFIKLDFDIKKFIRKEVLYYFLVVLVLTPLAIFFIPKMFGLDLDLRLGLFIAAITPTATAAPIITDTIKGDRELMVSSVVFANLISPFTYTALLSIFFDNDIDIPAEQILIKISTIIFIPLIAALLIRKFTKFKEPLIKFSKFNPLLLLCVLFAAVSSASSDLRDTNLETITIVFAYTMILVTFSFAIGFWLPKNLKAKKALASVFGHKNNTLGIWIVIEYFSDISARTIIPVLIYIICHHIINGFLINKFAN